MNASSVANGLWLGADVEGILAWFVEHQLVDGDWSCEWVQGSARSSFHSTLNTVLGLLAHEVATGGSDATRAARHAGEEYLLARDLLRRRSTGELVGPWALRFAYPFRWASSVLRVTDHLRRAAVVDGTTPDPRAAEAVELVRAARQPEGTWTQGGAQPGRVWSEVDVGEGEPSPWFTC